MMWTDEQVRRATHEPEATGGGSGGFATWATLALIGGMFLLSALFPVNQNEVLRHRCDQHGGIYRSAVDGGNIIAVTCADGEQFSR